MAELKFHDVDADDMIGVGVQITLNSCNLIAQGVEDDERVGRQLVVENIQWKYIVTLPNAANATSGKDTVRLILYLDKQANGAVAVPFGPTGILESDSILSFDNLANQERFDILMDRKHTLTAQGGAGDGTTNDLLGTSKYGEFNLDCKIPMNYESAGAVTPNSNNLGLVTAGENGFASLASKVRLRFTDY